MNNIKYMLIIFSLLLLSACGGGGGGSTSQSTENFISGVVSKGIIANGTVTVFALNADGSKGAQLASGSTDSSGAYNLSIGFYTGAVIVEASGSYNDEATGLVKSVPASAPLRAALAQTNGSVALSVTPLTDLAVRQAGTLTAQNISTANTLVSELFKVDIVATAPAAPTAAAFQAGTTTQAEKDYALVLAGVSQLMQSGGTDLATTLSNLNGGISQAGMSSQTAATIATAINSFVANPANQTGVTTVAGTSLQAVGATTMKLTMALQGNAAASVKGAQGTIVLPNGVTLRAATTGRVLNGVIVPLAGTPSGIMEGKYTAAALGNAATVTIGFVTSGNITAGDLLVVEVDLPPGVAAPAAGTFALSGSSLVDADGNSVSGASLSLH